MCDALIESDFSVSVWVGFNFLYCYEDPLRDFVAVGYTKRYLCRQAQTKMAIPGGIVPIAWVDATNIKINPSKNALLVGV